MKASTREGVDVASKRPEKERITDQEEDLFWQKGLLGSSSSEALLNSVYFYNGKLFGLRSAEHRHISLNNFVIGDNFIKFEENVSKTFHGGLLDLKYEPRVVRHICHEEGKEHTTRCLVKIYRLYISLAEICNKNGNAFYYRPDNKQLGFFKSPVGVNTLAKILPNMCKAVGVKVKTSHSLRVTCATALFEKGVEEKLIRDRTGHRSNALLRYEKSTSEQNESVSSILGPVPCTDVGESKEISKCGLKKLDGSAQTQVNFQNSVFNDCNISFWVKKD